MVNKDIFYIQKTFKLALKGKGSTSPNPLVGAIVVKNGRIIGEGHHQKYGDAHAEVNAINNARESVENATLYSNLEPCCHKNKQTPPCTNLLIEEKIKRVVIANLDPNPLVNGKGINKLRKAGIEVVQGVLENEGKELNRIFFKYTKNKIPYIHLKIAQTLDGRISTASGNSKWISDEDARAEVHSMRSQYDAVMIGRNTLNIDDPQLNIRWGNKKSQAKIPYRIIVGNSQKINLSSRILNDEFAVAKTIVISSEDVIPSLKSKGITFIKVQKNSNGIDLKMALQEIGKLKISSILVEGGSVLLSSFIKDNLYDELTTFICPKIVGNGPSFFEGQHITNMENAHQISNIKIKKINEQIILNSRNKLEEK